MGFWSNVLGRRRVRPGITHDTDNGLTEGLLSARHEPLGTQEGNPSAVDALDAARWAAPFGGVDADVGDMAVAADIGADMITEGGRLDDVESRMFDAFGPDADPAEDPDGDPGPPGPPGPAAEPDATTEP